jgi:hypothetical protein
LNIIETSAAASNSGAEMKMASGAGKAEKGMEETVRQCIAELATLDEAYFGKDREKQIRGKI